jgi:hypothetical protein
MGPISNTPSSLVREREREREREGEGEGERERERKREREKKRVRWRKREREERDVEYIQNCYSFFLRGMTGGLAPFSYLVLHVYE